MNKNFWKHKRVLITGYEGFLGSNLTRTLVKLGACIVGSDILVRRQDTILTKDDFKKITVIKGDVLNYSLIKLILRQHKIEIIMHLAAETIVTKSQANPIKTFQTNIKGTWNILEASRQYGGIEAIVIASSDKAYGAGKRLPYVENMPLRADHPYDVSKACADLITHTYFHTYGVQAAVTRCGNIYGPGDRRSSRIVPDTIRSILRGEKLLIRSDGKFTRDYVYVDDVVAGYIALAENMRRLKLAGCAFNLSNGRPISVLALVRSIYKIAGARPNYEILNQASYEIKKQYLCAKYAQRILGWRPKYSLEQGLVKTIQWHKKLVSDLIH